MEEPKRGGGGESSSRVSTSFAKSGDRQVFSVELRPGETTYVSWKKLTKDANKVNGSASASAPDPPPNAHPNLESRIAPGQPAKIDVNDEPAPNRFSAVIEKIERLYMGKDSSDDEELNDIPDDDQYDTEDSFIDDAELDEYFEVDNSAIKHDGFFVNRGKLERINEPPVVPNQQPKKRRRKDLTKSSGENDDGHASNKHVKLAKATAGKIPSLLGKSSSNPQDLAVTSGQFEDLKLQNQLNASVSSKKKAADTNMTFDLSSSLKVSNGDGSLSLVEANVFEKPKTGSLQTKSLGNKLRDASGSSDLSHQKYLERTAHAQCKAQSGKSLSNVDDFDSSVRPREKNGTQEVSDNNVLESKHPMQMTKTSHMIKRDASSIKSKGSVLEKAIRELEKMVAESRPPAMENQEADASSQAVKRRLPREIKLKLAKVARLAQASQGKISKELLNRLMSILGHLVQLRTLKRNLNIMISMGLSAKQEKDDRFQQIKKEVIEMIKSRISSLDSKAFEQQTGSVDDFREKSMEEKGALKRKFSIDAVMEDKICDLYDLYVDGLDDDAGPQIRKLYVELAELWPNGFMDNHGIKRAICRAKERRRPLYSSHKDQEKIKRKKMLAPRLEETVRADTTSVAQPQYTRDKLVSDSGIHGVASASKVSSSATAAIQIPGPSTSGSSLDRVKPEKLKGSLSNNINEAKITDNALTKKKVKGKAELNLDGTLFRPEKMASQSGEERHKSIKQAAILPHKPNLQSTSPSFEQSS